MYTLKNQHTCTSNKLNKRRYDVQLRYYGHFIIHFLTEYKILEVELTLVENYAKKKLQSFSH